MSEYYSRYNRYERLSQFRFPLCSGLLINYNTYFDCVCSRIYIRDAFKIYCNEREDMSESDTEVIRDHPQTMMDDQSHVHFSVDTSDNVKFEKDEGASCYCSASHTDNYCSTDEHDPAQLHGTMAHALQPSDSGADLTYQDCHSDHASYDKLEKMDEDFFIGRSTEVNEDYLSQDTWEKFWAINGERIIWASWIEKYSDYINPSYLDENNELMMDENHIPKEQSSDQIFDKVQTDVPQKNVEADESIRERKFSYDSKVNPYKKSHSNQSPIEKSDKSNELTSNKDDTWLPIGRRRSCSEHDRMLSPRTLAGTDSMTNVTKITISSYDVTSSHVTSESTPTDDYSVSSSTSTSDDPSNDQTRIANIDENTDLVPSNEIDSEEYWQYLWKKHFGEQYAIHYANYVEAQNWHYANHVEESTEPKDLLSINVEMATANYVEESIETKDLPSINVEMATANYVEESIETKDLPLLNVEMATANYVEESTETKDLPSINVEMVTAYYLEESTETKDLPSINVEMATANYVEESTETKDLSSINVEMATASYVEESTETKDLSSINVEMAAANYVEESTETKDLSSINVEMAAANYVEESTETKDLSLINVEMAAANYVEESTETKDLPLINVEMTTEKKTEEKTTEFECENSEGNSQEMPSVIEVQTQIDKINIEEKVTKSRKRIKKSTNNYIRSVGVLLQNLLMEEQRKSDQNEVAEGPEGEGSREKTEYEVLPNTIDGNMNSLNVQQSVSNSIYSSYNYDDEEDDDPPEEIGTSMELKRSHVFDYEEVTEAKVIKTVFEIMGFCVDSNNMPKAKLLYKNRLTKLRPPRYKRGGTARKTYFDDDGNPYTVDQTQDTQEREMQTDEDCPEVKLDAEKSTVPLKTTDTTENINTPYDVKNKEVCDNETPDKDVTSEASAVPFPPDVDNSFNDIQDSKQESKEQRCEELQREGTVQSLESSVEVNRRRRAKRYDVSPESSSRMPPELRGDSRMGKYWKRRHSLFHRFDEGVRLDFESWFSVTPESVAAHIADKCGGDVVVDAFCGAGGNTIQFAKSSRKVIAIDIDPVKIELAKHNARVYGVEHKIEFIVGDFFELAATVKGNVVFLSPPWGGLDYNEKRHYDIETMLKPRPASELMRVAQTISSSVVMYLPRTSKTDQLLQIAGEHRSAVEVEQSYLDKRFVAITAYFYK